METATTVKVDQRSNGAASPVAVLRFQGDITSTSRDAIMGAYHALAPGTKQIILDFTKVEYLNSSGIAILIHLLMEAHKTGQTIHCFGLSPHFQKVFKMVGMTKYTHLYADEAEAAQSFA